MQVDLTLPITVLKAHHAELLAQHYKRKAAKLGIEGHHSARSYDDDDYEGPEDKRRIKNMDSLISGIKALEESERRINEALKETEK